MISKRSRTAPKLLTIFLPEQAEGDALAAHLAVDHRPVRLRPLYLGGRQRWKQERFQHGFRHAGRQRPADRRHTGTPQIVADRGPARSEDDFLTWLKSVNALVMQARPDKNPGEWKDKVNPAGNTLFVDPSLVPGTLREGFARILALQDPFARALMTMFVISEVHPFQDGNGRTARLAMNAELTANGLSRIIIPTVYREDYLLPLKALSNNRDPVPYLVAMSKIQEWTASFDYGQPRSVITEALKACHAFEEDLRRFRLIFPEVPASYLQAQHHSTR